MYFETRPCKCLLNGAIGQISSITNLQMFLKWENRQNKHYNDLANVYEMGKIGKISIIIDNDLANGSLSPEVSDPIRERA